MIGTAAAIIGSAVLGAGATMLASSNASKAAKGAADTEYQATQANIAENRRQFDAIQANNAPFRDIGVSAIGALGSSFGLPGYGPAPSMTNRPVASTPVPNAGGLLMTQGQYTDRGTGVGTQAIYPDKTGMVRDPASVGPTDLRSLGGPAGQVPDNYASSDSFRLGTPPAGGSATGGGPGGSVDWMKYLQDNPDALANYNDIHASGRTDALANDPIAFAQFHWQDDGARRPLPMTAATAPQGGGATGPSAPPGYNDPTSPGGYMTGPRPDPGSAPARTPYGALDIGLGSYQKSPYYDFVQSEGLKGLDHVASSMGGLMSGARVKAAERFNNNLASTDYTDWRNYTTGQYNIDRGRADNQYTQDLGQYDADRARSDGLYADDRAFTTGRYDTRNNQLMSLAGFGSASTNATNNAAQSFAQSDAQARMAGATAQGNGQIQGANALTSGINNLVTTGAYLGGRLMSNPTSYYGVNPSYSPPLFTGADSEIAGLY
jgi:hypothetical protein